MMGQFPVQYFIRSFSSLITREHFHFLEGLPWDCVYVTRSVLSAW
jgi:hypothetical protein